MIDGAVTVLVVATAVGCGVMAGVFYAFSTGVMAALGRLPPERGAAAMQSINLAVINPLFLGLFVGTAVLCLASTVAALLSWGEAGSVQVLVGAAAYVLGTFVLTGAVNVPMNNALAVVDADSASGQEVWARYLTRWTAWNHVRTLAAALACTAFVLALLAG